MADLRPMQARRARLGATSLLYTITIIAILVLLNWLANRYNKSYDSTSNKRYSLSDQTEKVVKGLNENVQVLYFDRPGDLTRGRDLLDRYDTLSTKLSVDYVDVAARPLVARQYGVNELGKVVLARGERTETADSLSEEAITGALVRLVKGGKRTVCFVQGSGENSLDDTGSFGGYGTIKNSLTRNNFEVRPVSLVANPQVPAECTIAVVGGPRREYLQPVVDALKTYVEQGGRALFLVSPPLQLKGQETAENKALVDMLAGWGVTLDRNLIFDLSGAGRVVGLGPAAPLVQRYEQHPITQPMVSRGVSAAFPWSRSVDGKVQGKASSQRLFSTGPDSFATNQLDKISQEVPSQDRKGPLNLAVAGRYEGGTPGKEGRFVVVGSADWIGNQIPFRALGNEDLFLNMLNWLSQDEDLISIRPKDPDDRRLTMSEGQLSMVFFTSVVFLPLMAVLAGASVWWKRR